MTSETQLRAALERAAEAAPTFSEAYETKVRAVAGRRVRTRRRIALVAVSAATVAVSALALTVPGLLDRGHEQQPPAQARPLTLGPVAAGPHLLDPTREGERVTLGPGWTVTSATPGDARLSRPGSSGFVGFGEVTSVYVPGASMRATRSRDLVGWLKSHPDLRLVTSHVVRLDGYVGTDLLLRVVATPSTVDASCTTTCLPLFALPRGPVDVAAGATLHLIAINEAGRELVAYSSATATDYPAWSAVADQVLHSLRLK